MNPLSYLKKLIQQIGVKLKPVKNSEVGSDTLVQNSTPIVFVNKPICNSDDDVLFYSTQADAITTAVSQGANMIGVIADYGAGKTSLTELLCLQDSKAKQPISIYLWDSLSKHESSGDNEVKPIAAITRSFLYQLACGNVKDDMYARNINWRLSRNYGVLSVTPTRRNFWIYIIIASLVYIIPQSAMLSFTITAAWLKFILNALSPWGAAIIALIGLVKTNVAFSLWDSQGKRQPESSDTYSLFSEIIREVFAEDIRRYVFIEDLDRIKDKATVIEFLKEVYKFNALLKKEYKKRVVFVVSVMPEYRLSTKELKDEYGAHLYSKIFDYLVVLPSIHIHDYESVLLDILKTNKEQISKIIGEPLDKKMPSQFAWLIKGDNLTVRDIKNRLNICFSIYERLRRRQNTEGSLHLQLSKCAAVAYLLDRYPESISCLMQNEVGFDTLVSLSTQLHTKCRFGTIEESKMKEDLAQELVKALEEVKGSSIELRKKIIANEEDKKRDELFQTDLVDLLTTQFVEDDYHQYFYTYPKHSRILKVHENRVKTLLLSNGIVDDELLADILTVRKNSPDIITSQVQLFLDLKTGLPNCVFSSKDLFEIVFEEFSEDTSKELVRLLNWEQRKLDSTKKLLNFLENEVDSKYHKKLLELLADLLVEKLEAESIESISLVRQILIQILGADMKYMTPLFHEVGMPLIQETEMALVSDVNLIIELTAIDLIDEYSAKSISNWISKPFVTQNFEGLDRIWENCLSCDDETAAFALVYLEKNSRYNDSIFCSILDSQVCDHDAIIEYVNSFSPTQISRNAWRLLNQYSVFGGYSIAARQHLINQKLYKLYLLDLSEDFSIPISSFKSLNIDLLRSAMKEVYTYDQDRFIELRHALPAKQMRLMPALYQNEFPFITDVELQKCTSFDMAISLINFNNLSLRHCNIVASHLTRLSSGRVLCKKLFDEVFSNEDIDVELRKAIYSATDFSVVPFACMTITAQEECVQIIKKDLAVIESGRDALAIMKQLRTPIASLEHIIAEDKSSNEEKERLISDYMQFIAQSRLFTLETIDICRDHWLNIPMWEEFEDILLTNGETENCLVSIILRTKSFAPANLPPQIGLISIARVLAEVPACQKHIRSDKKCLAQLMHTPDCYPCIKGDSIWFFIDCRQKTAFIKHAFSKLNDNEKFRYIINMSDLDTKEDDRLFYNFMCEEENLKLAAESNMFKLRVGYRLYGGEDSKRKDQYYKKVKKYRDTHIEP
jgi:hypothetical protein